MNEQKQAIWTSEKLGTLTVEKARMFGMPHVGAKYTSKTGDHYRMLEGARCMVCGQPAAHVHHEPNKGMGGHATLELAGHGLRPALFALCQKCHDQRHFAHNGDRLSIRWRWAFEPTSHEYEKLWVEGGFFESGFMPHDERLFWYGWYEIFESDRLVKEYGRDFYSKEAIKRLHGGVAL